MPELSLNSVIQIIQSTLQDSGQHPDVTITEADSMDTVAAWDSLSFMRVFLAINEAFQIEPDFDEAIHYTSVRALHAFLLEKLG